mmetsp:Transcript_81174/g.118855  ORF Transcript_81174/g.118855 Transcript_81174/m.118855 type:complete len:81 (+) Transcript_81174:141-383(+)
MDKNFNNPGHPPVEEDSNNHNLGSCHTPEEEDSCNHNFASWYNFCCNGRSDFSELKHRHALLLDQGCMLKSTVTSCQLPS